jgi:hypothetical protein
MSERREFPCDHGTHGNPIAWEREWESELDGNGNDSTGMGIGQFPLKGKKKLITHCSVIQCFS